MVPKWVLAVVALVVAALLVLDVGSQIWVQGHTANPLVVGGAFTLFMALLTGARGPKPPTDSTSDESDPEPPPRTAGRHGART